MELKPKHILPYIPYGLYYGMEYKDIGTLKDTTIVKGVLTWRGTNDNLFTIFDFDYKPILTPISVLFGENHFETTSWVRLLRIGNHDYDMLKDHRTTMVSFGTIQKLYEYHIDFQGLINDKLALDGTKIPNFEIKKPKKIK